MKTMKDSVIVICFFFILTEMTFGQSHAYKVIDDADQKVINDLSSTFKDTSISFLLSPFVGLPIDTFSLNIHEVTKKYGFSKDQILNITKDTLILQKNDYFKILNSDSLIKYKKVPDFTLLNVSDNSYLLLTDPELYYIKKYYGKRGICSFRKIVYSKNRDYALVEYWMHCGSLCGYGETVVMKKMRNKWIIKETLIICQS